MSIGKYNFNFNFGFVSFVKTYFKKHMLLVWNGALASVGYVMVVDELAALGAPAGAGLWWNLLVSVMGGFWLS